MTERDKNDSTRAIAPCVQAEDAVLLDNSDLDFEQTVKKVIKIIKKNSKSLYKSLIPWLAPIIRFFQRIKPIGIENIPTDRGYMICANHIAAKDVIMIGAAYPEPIRFIAKKELFSVPILGRLIKKLGAIKLDRSGNDVAAIKTSVNLARSGLNVAIFPQGHRYPGVDPATTQAKNGAALIAYRSESDILPVFIKTKDNKYRFLRKIEIVFGKPIKYSELGFVNGGSDEYKAATDKIFAEILKLGGYDALPHASNKESSN
jgi:1-acyl-sn-glycerol-3-phosphate acyltransferase